MADQEFVRQTAGDYSKEGVLKTLRQVSQSDLRDCQTIFYLLDRYHVESGDPVHLFGNLYLQLYPVRPGSLHVTIGLLNQPRPTNFLYKVTLHYKPSPDINIHSEDVFQGLLIGRLMKAEKGTHYVVFLTARYGLYACLSTTVDKYEASSPYYDDDGHNPIPTRRSRVLSVTRRSSNSLLLLKWSTGAHWKT
ncbi:hypothetical protein DL98DRAFT_535016 [Cadophora sp. DSE1049]|nr:hypothetical protein DL98DRAFT_535016 [Cadophora sp. DSE1049]